MAKPIGFGGRDYPDFGVSGLQTSKISLSDMSELAVRLGSINRFDRSGVVIFEEAFRQGISRWGQNSYPSGAFAVPVADYFSIVPYAALLATTLDSGSYSGLSTVLPIPYTSTMGFEWHVKFRDEIELFYFWVQVYTGTVQYRVVFRMDVEDSIVDILNSGGTYTTVYTKALHYGGVSAFHVFKVVVDLVNELHVRMVIDGVDIDLSAYDVYKTTDTTSPRLYLYVSNNPGTSSIVNRVYLDNIIITLDEPT